MMLATTTLAAMMALAGAAAESRRPWMQELRAAPPEVRARSLLAKMTLAEKLVMLHGHTNRTGCPGPTCAGLPYVGNVPGNARLNIPPLTLNDGPQGFRDNLSPGTTTAWPSGMTMAASFDKDIMFEWGSGMGKEFKAKGSNVQLGPGLCLARVPRNGRNFEYAAGEDPYLGYHLIHGAISGIQSENVIANAKHWVNNNQETNRHGVTEIVDDRTRFEMYYPPFAGAIKAGVGSVMCSYNKINADSTQHVGDNLTWSCENPLTLKRDLKQRLNFSGWVMSDWGACHSASIMQGLDQEMPGDKYMSPDAIQARLGADITQAAVDESVMRMLTPMFSVGVMDAHEADPTTWSYKKLGHNVTTEASVKSARKLAAQCTVLLKNKGKLLPLSPRQTVAVIGFGSDNTVVHAGGSGSVVPSSVVTPLQGLNSVLAQPATYSDGTDLQEATGIAKAADVAIVFVATLSHEGGDRASLSLDDGCVPDTRPGHTGVGKPCVGNANNQNAMVSAIAKANPHTVVVMSVPGAVLTPWAAEVAAIVTNFMPGQAAGDAIADIVFGKVNPSARLPVTFPNKENEQDFTPAQWPGLPDPEAPLYANYSEGLLVGYRYYDAHDIEPAFAFGHGLSYTTFKYSALKVSGRSISVEVANVGKVAGAEIPQLYLGYPAEAGEPRQVLRGFTTLTLQPGAKDTATFELEPQDTSIFDSAAGDWKQVKGEYKIGVGASSRDIRLTATAKL